MFFNSLKKACFQHRVAIRIQICSRAIGDKYPEIGFQFKAKLFTIMSRAFVAPRRISTFSKMHRVLIVWNRFQHAHMDKDGRRETHIDQNGEDCANSFDSKKRDPLPPTLFQHTSPYMIQI